MPVSTVSLPAIHTHETLQDAPELTIRPFPRRGHATIRSPIFDPHDLSFGEETAVWRLFGGRIGEEGDGGAEGGGNETGL